MEARSWEELADEQELSLQNLSAISVVSTARGQGDAPSHPGAPTGPRMEEGDQDPLALQSLFRKVVRRGLVENMNEVEIQQRDPNSPLYSVYTFEKLNLKPELLKGVYGMGFNSPSKIQEVALPALMNDPPFNLIAQSQSGTGKTATFVLAFLHRVIVEQKHTQILCLSPTYELAIQTGEVAAKMGINMKGLTIKYAIRGEHAPRGVELEEHVIIGTPGKVLDWIRMGVLNMKTVTTFVLDEADIMVAQQGHQDQTYRIHKFLLPTCHRMFFSATYTDVVVEFAKYLVPDPMIIRLKREEETLHNIRQRYVYCQNENEKYTALTNIYGTISIGQAIIFTHTRATANGLYKQMSSDGHAVGVLNGDLDIETRLSVLDMFREGKYKALIATNVLSRGIDVEQTTLVINWDMPVDYDKSANCETYLHRIGRTGRFGKSGIAINLVDSPEAFTVLHQIEEHFGVKIPRIDVNDQEEFEKLDS